MNDDKREYPYWWPKNPYPADIFTADNDRFKEALPDPDVRTAVAGYLGREFWGIASKYIFDLWQEHKDE